jgi:hypothetical protein
MLHKCPDGDAQLSGRNTAAALKLLRSWQDVGTPVLRGYCAAFLTLLRTRPDAAKHVPGRFCARGGDATTQVPLPYCVDALTLLYMRPDCARQLCWRCYAGDRTQLLRCTEAAQHVPWSCRAGALIMWRKRPDDAAQLSRRRFAALKLLRRWPNVDTQIPSRCCGCFLTLLRKCLHVAEQVRSTTAAGAQVMLRRWHVFAGQEPRRWWASAPTLMRWCPDTAVLVSCLCCAQPLTLLCRLTDAAVRVLWLCAGASKKHAGNLRRWPENDDTQMQRRCCTGAPSQLRKCCDAAAHVP